MRARRRQARGRWRGLGEGLARAWRGYGAHLLESNLSAVVQVKLLEDVAQHLLAALVAEGTTHRVGELALVDEHVHRVAVLVEEYDQVGDARIGIA